MAKAYKAPIVKKAFDILREMSSSDSPLGISDVAARLGISKSTVHGIFSALQDHGAIAGVPGSRKFVLGPTLVELGRSAFQGTGLQEQARPVMEDLGAQCRESVFLGLRNRERVTVIDIVESEKDLKITSPVGTFLPLLAGAVGKVFLASVATKKAKDFLKSTPLPQFTPKSIVSQSRYLAVLEQVKQQGYAFDDEEYITGVRAVAVKLVPWGPCDPALWVVGFKNSMDDGRLKKIIRLARQAADQIDRNRPSYP